MGMSPEPLVTEELIAKQSPEAQAIIRLLLARIAEQDRRIAALEADVAALKKTPRNSSLPPSAEHPHAKPPRDKKASKKKRGGQPGHPKHERVAFSPEKVDKAQIMRSTPARYVAASWKCWSSRPESCSKSKLWPSRPRSRSIAAALASAASARSSSSCRFPAMFGRRDWSVRG